ncbi:MAG: signal peptidase II [Firmicutes bacterium]|nr:signal peptidase II [Bacillota bacterium]
MPKPRIRTRLITLAAAAALVAADRLIKSLITGAVTGRALIPGILGLRYTQNTGISFSLFGDSRAAMLLISVLTALVMLAGVVWLLLGKIGGAVPLSAAALILAGGVSNLADRLARGFVVDYIELLFVRFAIFNFADICITCGVVLMAGWVLWTESRRHKTAVKN